MQKFLLWFFLVPLFLRAEWDQVFLEEDDPAIVQNVNVMTGNLNVCLQEKVVRGAIPFPIALTYSSKGAEEANDVESLKLKKLRNVLELDGGWSIFPHLALLVDTRQRMRPYSYVMEPSGAQISFDPKGNSRVSFGQSSGSISGRRNPSNHHLQLDLNASEAILYLADGGVRLYRGEKDFFFSFLEESDLPRKSFRYLMLVEETLPSGHRIFYDYTQDEHFEKVLSIRITNPKGNKTFSHIFLKGDLFEKHKDFKTVLHADDGTFFKFGHQKYKDRKYLTFDEPHAEPRKQFQYTKVRKGVGLSLEKIFVGDREAALAVEYYKPDNEKESAEWKKNPDLKPYKIDKVKSIRNPAGVQATFEYFSGVTNVRDVHQVLTRYHHSKDKLDWIEYFDKNGEHVSSEIFKWDNGLLIEKTMCDAAGHRIFSKSFEYDSYKNVVKERVYNDHESFTKWYEYNDRHLLSIEREEEGPTYRYEYVAGTDLISHKWTCDLEESYVYDDDNLLIEKRVIDGPYEQVTRYKRDPKTRMIVETIEPLQRRVYTYNKQRLPIREDVFDAEGMFRYSLYTEYDSAGRVLKQTTPSGGENTYSYDPWGNPTIIKEVGKPAKHIQYDVLDRPIRVEVNGKAASTTYDPKGWVLTERDHRGGATTHRYDSFGRCILTVLANGTPLHFTHDLRGNITTSTSGNGYVTSMAYNLLQKVVRILEPNGGETLYHYYPNGELRETVFPEGGSVTFEYDTLHRLISKRQSSIEEKWEYEGSFLKSYTDPTGLVTRNVYDEYGRKIEETTGDRRTQFFYDALGFPTKTVRGDEFVLEVRDAEGRVLEESVNGFNHIVYTYDSEGRKVQARKGEAIDRFAYDVEGRLVSHVDPLGHETRFIHGDFSKTTVDPVGNSSVDTFDLQSRLIKTERKSPEGQTCGLEEFFHDRDGNVVKRVTTVFPDERKIEVDFEYNSVDLLTREIEANQKVTTYQYDKKGRVVRRISPNGVSLNYLYNEFDAVVEMKSSDGTVHYCYEYEHLQPVAITDVTMGMTLTQSYTSYGELASERWQFPYAWKYDNNGRVVEFTLPDESSVQYTYQGGHMSEVKRGGYSHAYLKFDRNRHVEEEALVGGSIQKSKRDLLERVVEVVSPFHKRELAFSPSGLVTRSNDKEYRYDPLNQLVQEGDEEYRFDSLGNPTKYAINSLNQITATEDETLIYDPNGDLIERRRREGTIYYGYDALQRLTSITSPREKILFSYDPLSRLSRIDLGGTQKYLLYDREFEIGLMEDGEIKELKVLGLGIQGDIGAAIAIELSGKLYTPLHDLQGNITALATPSGIIESYHISSFGVEPTTDYQNPWRFSSKRSLSGLIYFGKRFYDPGLKRWLTPDPLGFADGRNLYAYVCNSPLNRLDLFGLAAVFSVGIAGEGKGKVEFRYGNFTYGPPMASREGFIPQEIFGMADINGVSIPCIFICTKPIRLNFTPRELAQNQFNLFDHMDEILPSDTDQITFASYSNGMANEYGDWVNMGRSYAGLLPQGVPIMSVFNEGMGFLDDLCRVRDELSGTITPPVHALRAFFTEMHDTFDRVSPNAKWLHASHSEGGLQTILGGNAMHRGYRQRIRDRLYYFAVAPAQVAPKTFGHAKNIFSKEDRVTTRFAKPYLNNSDYDIQLLECITPKKQLGWFIGDHAFTNPTYQVAMKDHFDRLRTTVGFYVDNHR